MFVRLCPKHKICEGLFSLQGALAPVLQKADSPLGGVNLARQIE